MTQAVHLRPVTADDCKMIFDWANDPVTRAASFSSNIIVWEEHTQWFAQKLADPKCFFFIGMNEEEKPIGQVRFDCENSRAVISASVCPTCRGKGYGTALVQAACDRIRKEESLEGIDAYIKKENAASLRIFEKAGFAQKNALEYKGSPAVHCVREHNK